MTEHKKVRLDHLLGVYSVGSGDWPWTEEYDNLVDQPDTQKLLTRIRVEGIRETILLGTDGRIWDGHHRIVVAMHLGLDSVPVEFAGPVEKDARLARYMAMVTPLGYQSALTVVQEMTKLIDAETRARGVVAEEPEWEYGIALFGEMDDIQQWATEAKARAARQDAEDLLIRRRKAGPWVPVKQKGESDGMAG